MNVLEKIFEEIKERIKKLKEADNICRVNAERNRNFESVKYFQSLMFATERAKSIIGDIIRSHMSDNDELIDRKALKEEIESLRMTITGMRSGKTITIQALEEYKKSILRIIDEQPTVHANDGWISVEERLPEKPVFGEDSYIVQHKCIITPYSAYWDGENWTEDYSDEPIRGIIAWQPLPKAYRRHQKSLTQDAKRHIMDRFTKER